jgi:hypothetical protein
VGIAEAIRARGKLSSTQHEQAKAAGERLGRIYGLRLDLVRLDDDEKLKLLDLVRKATPEDQIGYGGVNLRQLDRGGRRVLEALVEKAAGLDEGSLDRQRKDAQALHKVAALAKEALRPQPPTREQENGLILEFAEQFEKGYAWPVHAGLVLFVAGQIIRAKPLAPNSRIEGQGLDAALVIDLNVGLGTKYDPEQRLSWQRDLGHVCANEWLAQERHGHELHLRLGKRLLRLLDRAPSGKPRRAA